MKAGEGSLLPGAAGKVRLESRKRVRTQPVGWIPRKNNKDRKEEGPRQPGKSLEVEPSPPHPTRSVERYQSSEAPVPELTVLQGLVL